ncbi:hypothetical protein FQR65_LT20962 [Abscondita terminalis]|nr:hypothetical protein FQR65_LT20962 [Abscondita terminalis]
MAGCSPTRKEAAISSRNPVDACLLPSGTSHGAYKVSPSATGSELRIRPHQEIQAHPQHPSGDAWFFSVPQEWLAIIQSSTVAHQGNLRRTVEEIVRSSSIGVRQCHISTHLRLASPGDATFDATPASEFDPRKFLGHGGRMRMCALPVSERSHRGHASEIKADLLEGMSSVPQRPS